ncbi:MAG: hypothetical protein PHT92_01765 [Bacteroidales bacterium]|nr:hypothetical protein [Bacteroidales bacterium]
MRHCDPDVLCREKQSLSLIYNQLLLREKYSLPAASLPPPCRLPAACLPAKAGQRQGKGRAKAGQKQARNIKFIIILLYHKFFITLGIFADNHYFYATSLSSDVIRGKALLI